MEGGRREKCFNLTGLCIPDRHYMVDMSEKVDRIVSDYIDRGAYFTINRARQFGKTTLLSCLQRKLSDRYLVIRMSFEGVDEENFDSSAYFVNMFRKNAAKRLRQMKVEQRILDEWNMQEEFSSDGDKAFDVLGDKITALCSSAGKGVLLLIDEVDKCSDNQVFLNFLGMLRNKYLDMQEQMDITFQSVILASVYDVKNLKLKLRPDEEKKYNSPWNIAVDFQVEMRFSIKEISDMLERYSEDTGISMNTGEVAGRIYFYTKGYPYLVSWLCKWIDEKGKREWTGQGVDQAEKELLKNDNTLFDDMIKNIENNKELYKVVSGILLDGLKMPFVKSDPVISMGTMFGILAEQEGIAAVSNIVFETFLYNHMIAGKIREQYALQADADQFVEGGRLNMKQVLRKFQELMKAEYREDDDRFIEQQGRLLFLCFIKPIINGKGSYYVEPETRGRTRMDVVIFYGEQEHIVELKIWHGKKYRQKGLEQLGKYMDSRNCREGYLVSFEFNKSKKYICNTITLEEGGREIFEITM